MGTRKFSRVPAIYVLSKNKENINFFHVKIIFFTAVKNCSILHGPVFVMNMYTYEYLDLLQYLPA